MKFIKHLVIFGLLFFVASPATVTAEGNSLESRLSRIYVGRNRPKPAPAAPPAATTKAAPGEVDPRRAIFGGGGFDIGDKLGGFGDKYGDHEDFGDLAGLAGGAGELLGTAGQFQEIYDQFSGGDYASALGGQLGNILGEIGIGGDSLSAVNDKFPGFCMESHVPGMLNLDDPCDVAGDDFTNTTLAAEEVENLMNTYSENELIGRGSLGFLDPVSTTSGINGVATAKFNFPRGGSAPPADRPNSPLYKSRDPLNPRLAFQGGKDKFNARQNTSSYYLMNLGVDDEINKATMSVYQPLRLLRDFFNQDSIAERDYLGLTQTRRGIVLLTLSYLDRTIAANLGVAQAQTSQHTIQQLLEQLTLTNERIAKPHLEMLHRDVDEKIEACLIDFDFRGGSFTTNSNVTKRTPWKEDVSKLIEWCQGSCGAPEKDTAEITRSEAYDWCRCCSKALIPMNVATLVLGPNDEEIKTSNVRSLVDQLIYGSALHQVGADGKKIVKFPDETEETVRDTGLAVRLAEHVRGMYGDIVIDGRLNEEKGVTSVVHKQTYRFPLYTLQQKVQLIADGCEARDWKEEDIPGCKKQGDIPGDDREKPVLGICPSLIELFRSELERNTIDDERFDDTLGTRRTAFGEETPDEKEAREQMVDLFVKASQGYILSAEHIQLFLKKGDIYGEVTTEDEARSWLPSGELLRYIRSFCDASAVAAFKRIHYNTMSKMEDIFVLNQTATEEEKRQMRTLMDRVTKQIVTAEAMANADRVAAEQILGLKIEVQRMEAAKQQAYLSGIRRQLRNNADAGSRINWGRMGSDLVTKDLNSEGEVNVTNHPLPPPDPMLTRTIK